MFWVCWLIKHFSENWNPCQLLQWTSLNCHSVAYYSWEDRSGVTKKNSLQQLSFFKIRVSFFFSHMVYNFLPVNQHYTWCACFPWKIYQPKIAWLQEYWSSDEGHFYCVTPVLSLSMQPVCISSVTGLFIGQRVCEFIAELTLFYCQISRAVSCKTKSSSENTTEFLFLIRRTLTDHLKWK